MAVDVTSAFVAYVAGNGGPTAADPNARERPEYGLSASFDGAAIDLNLTFRAGSAYCCGEWQCHFMLFPTRRWDKLRRELTILGLELPARLELRVDVVIEAGAQFFAPGSPRAPRVLASSKAHRYRQTVAEGDRPESQAPKHR